MESIPNHLLKKIYAVLLECGPMSTYEELRAFFFAKEINTWKNDLPQAKSPRSQAQQTVEFLGQRFSQDNKNALILFLNVVRKQTDPEDACHQELKTLIDELEEFQYTVIPENTSSEPLSELHPHRPHESITSHPNNPFSHRGPIKQIDRQYFFGRKRETEQIFDMLRSHTCVNIIGPRRIGKTSLLYHLCDSEVHSQHNIAENYLLIYVDCQSISRNQYKSHFYERIWQETKRTLIKFRVMSSLPDQVDRFGAFREIMIKVEKQGWHPILLIDEFDGIVKSSDFDETLFENLRSLTPTITYTIASSKSLFDLTYEQPSPLSSPFFNVFTPIHLGFMPTEEAQELVFRLLKTVEKETFFSEEDIDFVFKVGGCFPFFLQLACYHLFDQKLDSGLSSDKVYETALSKFNEHANPHFTYIWQRLSRKEQKALHLIANGNAHRLKDEQMQQLEKRLLLHNREIFSLGFSEFIKKQKHGLIWRWF